MRSEVQDSFVLTELANSSRTRQSYFCDEFVMFVVLEQWVPSHLNPCTIWLQNTYCMYHDLESLSLAYLRTCILGSYRPKVGILQLEAHMFITYYSIVKYVHTYIVHFVKLKVTHSSVALLCVAVEDKAWLIVDWLCILCLRNMVLLCVHIFCVSCIYVIL